MDASLSAKSVQLSRLERMYASTSLLLPNTMGRLEITLAITARTTIF